MGSVTDELYCPRCEGTFAEGRTCPRDGNRLVRLSGQLDPLIGRDLDGRFTVLERLGQGGMGAVYRARQHSVEREVAVKVVHANLTNDAEAIKRFLREAKLSSRLTHPNAVGVLDFGQTSDGIFFLVMELVGGRTLDAELKEHFTLSPARLVRIGIQVCDALEAAHALSIVHRDLKPSNIMLTGRDFVKVLDFGLAKLMVSESDGDTSETGASLLGTPAYMPPERMTGGAADPRGDLYSLGCTLYLAGSGRLPLRAGPLGPSLLGSRGGPEPMTGVPDALAAVIDRLVAVDPRDRYQSAAEARTALEDVGLTTEVRTSQAYVSQRAPTDTVAGAASESVLSGVIVRRGRVRWAARLGAAVAVAVALVGLVAATREPDASPRAAAGELDPVPPPPPPPQGVVIDSAPAAVAVPAPMLPGATPDAAPEPPDDRVPAGSSPALPASGASITKVRGPKGRTGAAATKPVGDKAVGGRVTEPTVGSPPRRSPQMPF